MSLQILANSQDDIGIGNEAIRLTVRYGVEKQPVSAIGPDELSAI